MENYKGEYLRKNVGGVIVVNLCTSSGHALYYSTKFSEIILNGIKVIERHDFITEKYKGE